MSTTTAQAAKNKSKEKNDLSKPRQTATSQKRQLRSHEKRETTEPARTATTPTQQKKNTTGRELSQQEISVTQYNPGEEDGETAKKLISICREFSIDKPEDLRGILKKLYSQSDQRKSHQPRPVNSDQSARVTQDMKDEKLSKTNNRMGKKTKEDIDDKDAKINEIQENADRIEKKMKEAMDAKNSQVKELERRLQENTEELEKIRAERASKDTLVGKLERELQAREKELNEVKAVVAAKETEVGELNGRIKDKENEVSQLKTQLEAANKATRDSQNQKQQGEKVENTDTKSEESKQKKESKIEKVEDRLRSANKRIKELEIEVEKAKKEAEKNLTPDTRKLKEEIDQLKNRLSQLAGSKLTEGNPAIADLSDMNRPINLGEKFSELYDNQWTDAFEVLHDSGKGEEEVIKELVKILEDAYTFCKEQSQDFHENLRKLMQPFGMKQEALPTEVSKQIKDHRKNLSVSMVQNIQERFCKERQITDESKLKTYAKQCAGLCWFMMVQDPPLFMDTTLPKKNKFDSDKFRAYTKTGKRIDFLVWPALYLHAEGPLLSKGVAQGK